MNRLLLFMLFILFTATLCACATPGDKVTGTSPAPGEKTVIKPIKKAVLTETTVDQFISWASRSDARSYLEVREEINRARGDDAVLAPLFERYEKVSEKDLDMSLIILGIIGELKNPKSIEMLEKVIWQKLPEHEKIYDGRLTRRDVLEMQQSKAVEGLAYIGTELSHGKTLSVAAKHTSVSVRGAAIDAYLYNNNDSSNARSKLASVVRPEDKILIDRVRKTKTMKVEDFNSQLADFYKQYPKAVAPEPGLPTKKPVPEELRDTIKNAPPPNNPK